VGGPEQIPLRKKAQGKKLFEPAGRPLTPYVHDFWKVKRL